jgi:hypothetical protein
MYLGMTNIGRVIFENEEREILMLGNELPQ